MVTTNTTEIHRFIRGHLLVPRSSGHFPLRVCFSFALGPLLLLVCCRQGHLSVCLQVVIYLSPPQKVICFSQFFVFWVVVLLFVRTLECTIQNVSHNVNYGLWFIMINMCWFINPNKCTTPNKYTNGGGGCRGKEYVGTYCALHLKFTVKLKMI